MRATARAAAMAASSAPSAVLMVSRRASPSIRAPASRRSILKRSGVVQTSQHSPSMVNSLSTGRNISAGLLNTKQKPNYPQGRGMRHSRLGKSVALVGMFCGLAAAAPAPTSRPADQVARSAREKHAKAVDAVEAAKRSAAVAFDSGAGKSLVAEVERLRVALEAARAYGSTKEKLDASAAYNTARQNLAKRRDAAISSDPSVVSAIRVAGESAANAKLAEDAAAAAAAEAADAAAREKEAARAAAKRTPYKAGMSVEQVRDLARAKGHPDLVRESGEEGVSGKREVYSQAMFEDRPDLRPGEAVERRFTGGYQVPTKRVRVWKRDFVFYDGVLERIISTGTPEP